MKKSKKKMVVITVMVMLVMVLAITSTVAVSNASISSGGSTTKNMSLEERINGLDIKPRSIPDKAQTDIYDFSRLDDICNDTEMSNYDKMKTAYLDIASRTSGLSCATHSKLLGTAFEMLGHNVYGATGAVTTRKGKKFDTMDGLMRFIKGKCTGHLWIAVEIDGTSEVITSKETVTTNGKTTEYEYQKIKGEDIFVGNDVNLTGEILYFDLNLYSTYGMDFSSCFARPPRYANWYSDAGVGTYY